MTATTTGRTPREIDTRLAALHETLAAAGQQELRLDNWIHVAIGDTRHHRTRQWAMSDGSARAAARARVNIGTDRAGCAEKLDELDEIGSRMTRTSREIAGLDAIYREQLWNRYFLVTNTGGHVHRNQACSTCHPTTGYAWLPELSGCDENAMIIDFGEQACTVCFPAAPANPAYHAPGRRNRDAIAARDAEKAARQAVKDAKRLTAGEVFRTRYGPDRVETVAACKDLIRKPVETAAELAWFRSPAATPANKGWDEESRARMIRNLADRLVQQETDAKQAASVLLSRENRHPGWGATQAQIDKMIASKTKSAARCWT